MTPVFSLEGIDGSGKSTQQKLVTKFLEENGLKVATPTSPSHNILGEFIRSNVRQLEPGLRNRLFLLDIEYIDDTIPPDCDTVLWDRHVDSFYASNPEMDLEEAAKLTEGITPPLKTFFLDVDIETIMKLRTEVHDHHTIPEWLKMKAERYRELAQVEANLGRIVTIDGTLPPDEITAQISSVILEHTL